MVFKVRVDMIYIAKPINMVHKNMILHVKDQPKPNEGLTDLDHDYVV